MKKFWYKIKQFIETHYTTVRLRLKLINHAVADPSYDWAYLLRLEKVKLQEMLNYFKSMSHTFDHGNDIKWISICIKLLDIIVDEPEDQRYVNARNMWRFIRKTELAKGVEKEDVEHYYKLYPQDLRWIKAENLYYEIRKNYTCRWWD